MKHVLVVDDEPRIVDVLRDYLHQAGFRVTTASNGSDALRGVRSFVPDMVILDLGLPDMDGLDVGREIRRHSRVPIIMLTARADEVDRIVGLELGADDYVVKPFSARELVARVRAVFRRLDSPSDDETKTFVVGDVEVDPGRRHVTVAGEIVPLSSTEFDLVAAMARQPGRVFTRSQLLEVIHGIAIDSYERAVDSHVKNIRRKLEPDLHRPRYLLTVHGVGYRFAEE